MSLLLTHKYITSVPFNVVYYTRGNCQSYAVHLDGNLFITLFDSKFKHKSWENRHEFSVDRHKQ